MLREPDTDNATARADVAQANDASAASKLAPPVNTYTLFGVKRLWSLVAGLCLLCAVVLGWRNHLDATFVAATLGVVAWFLDQRNLLRARSIEADATEAESEEIDDEQ
ncbi:MAG: hypothetical protein DMF64_17095 [Acidobacteria bacterium]|nr:MAG: hypothetical protein DMF64_17095 [Acidobacteriota bacterium]